MMRRTCNVRENETILVELLLFFYEEVIKGLDRTMAGSITAAFSTLLPSGWSCWDVAALNELYSFSSKWRETRTDRSLFTTGLCLFLPRRGMARVTGTDTRAVIAAHACARTCQLQSDTGNKEACVKAQIRMYARVRAPMHEPISKHRCRPGLACKSCIFHDGTAAETHTHALYSTDGVQQSRWRAFISYCVGGMAN